MGSGAAQQPVTTVDQLGVHGALSLPLQSDNGVGQKETTKQTQNSKGQSKPKACLEGKIKY